MIFGTKIKWYSHLNKNAPLLANEWGSLVKVLDACLVDGFSEQQVTDITIVGNSLILKFPTAHQYQQYQVINITGANSPVLNGNHRIVEVSLDGLSMTIDYESLNGVVETSLMLTCKLPPIGWEKVFTGTNQAVYKFVKDTGLANYLFVDDTFPGTPYNTIWSKYARVGLAEDYDGDFTPKGATIPALWSDFKATVSGSNMILGTHKWFYATNTESTSSTNTFHVAALAGNRQWYLVGDPTHFYMLNATAPNSIWYNILAVGEYDCMHQGFKSNALLAPFTWAGQIQTNTAGYMSLYSSGIASSKGFYLLKSLLSDNEVFAAPVGYTNTLYSGYTNILSTSGPVNHFRILINSGGIIMGSPRNIYWLALDKPYANLQKIQQGSDVYLAFTQYLNGNSTPGQYVLKIGSSE